MSFLILLKYCLIFALFSGAWAAWEGTLESVSGLQTGLAQFDSARPDAKGFTAFAGSVQHPLVVSPEHEWGVFGDGGGTFYWDGVKDWQSEGGLLWDSPVKNGGWKREASLGYTRQSSLTDLGSAFEYYSLGLEVGRYWQKKHRYEAQYKVHSLLTGDRWDLRQQAVGTFTYKSFSGILPGSKVKGDWNYSSEDNYKYWGLGVSPFFLALLGEKYFISAFADLSWRNYFKGFIPDPKPNKGRGEPPFIPGQPGNSPSDPQKTLNTAVASQFSREVGKRGEIFVEYVFFGVYFTGSWKEVSASNRFGLGFSYSLR